MDRPEVTRRLHRLILAAVHIREAQEDLLQEALLYLCQAAARNPRQNVGWYLRSCAWRIKDLLKRGRIVDSLKNRARLSSLDQDPLDADRFHLVSPDNVFQNVTTNDLIAELSRRLVAPDNQVLLFLASGFRQVEIARELHLPAREVSRSRARIAQVAVELDVRR